MTHFDDQNPEETKQMSSAYRAAVIVFGAALAVVAFYLFLAWQLGAWQMYALSGVIVLFIVDNFLAMRVIKAGQTERGGWMIVIGMLVVFPAASLLVASVGLIFGIVLPALCIAVSTQILSRVQARRANAASIVVGVLTALLDLLPLEYRLFVPQIQAFVPSVATIIVVAVAFFAIRQNWHNLRNFMQSSIRNRLTTIVVGAAIVPVLLISIFLGIITFLRVRDALTQTTFDRLSAIESIKTNQLSSYFNKRQTDMVALSQTAAALRQEAIAKLEAVNELKVRSLEIAFADWDVDVRDVASDPGVVLGMRDLVSGFRNVGAAYVRSLYLGQGELNSAGDGSNYSIAHFEQHAFFAGYTALHKYEDAFLIDPEGNVVYSVHKNEVFGTNLVSGPFKDTNLAALFQTLKTTSADESVVIDAAFFIDKFAMFIGTPIYDGSILEGVLIYQIPLSEIDSIIQDRTGLTPSSETYLVSQTQDQIELRSNRIVKEGKIGDPKPGSDTEKALAGETGADFRVGSTGVYEISVYKPMELPGLRWAVLTTSFVTEVFVPTLEGQEVDFFTQFQQEYGFYDIFLISPDGFVFYTVAKEADFQTNILTSEFSDSNLADLVREVLESKSYEFADFALYEPSGGKPAAFFGIPQVNAKGEVEMILAAQVPVDEINQIMNEASGLGETGESYIIGPDFLGRMDSRFIDQFGVETTVLNPDYSVDTEAVRSALAGESGQGTIIDYRGLPVISAWAPFSVSESETSNPENELWAVMTEIDASEALTPVNQLARNLAWIIGLAALVVGALAVLVGTRFALGFVTPILNLSDTATKVAAGNLDLRVASNSADEIGTLTTTFNDMTAQLQDTLEGLEQRVADRTKALATSAEVTRRLAAILDPRQLVSEVVEQIKRAYNFYYTQIYLLDESGTNLVIAGGTGEAGASMLARKHSVPKGRGLVGRAADVNASVLIPDVSQEEGWLPNDLLPETKAEAAIPISVGNQVLGVLDVQHSLVNGLTPDDVTLLESLAGQVAISLQNARSYEQSRKQAELESLVNVIGQRIQRTTSIEETLQTAIRELGTAIGAPRVKASLRAGASVLESTNAGSVTGHVAQDEGNMPDNEKPLSV